MVCKYLLMIIHHYHFKAFHLDCIQLRNYLHLKFLYNFILIFHFKINQMIHFHPRNYSYEMSIINLFYKTSNELMECFIEFCLLMCL